jgi:hypothetical protein
LIGPLAVESDSVLCEDGEPAVSYFDLEIFCGVVGYVASKTIDFEECCR